MNNYEDYGGGYEDEVGSDFNLLDRVRVYVSTFYNMMADNNVSEVRNLYCKEWKDITNAYYKDVEWPRANEVAMLCENHEVFLLCYNELYYRHIFVNGNDPQIHHRFESWNNYRKLFDTFLDNDLTESLVLPSEWVNDMIDEFLYQYQDFCAYKHGQNLSPAETKLLSENPNVWQTETVLGYLTSFVQRSQIVKVLEAGTSLHGIRMTVLTSFGYFSLFGLCRIHCLLADYRLAIQTLAPIDIDDKRALFTRVAACHVTLFYNIGFAYLMMRRYKDAVGVFSAVLLAHRGSKNRNNSFADLALGRTYDRIRSVCAIAISLSPGIRVDQQVMHIVMEKHGEAMNGLNRREEVVFEKLFASSCPKFVIPGQPDFSAMVRPQVAYQRQLKLFLQEVRQQQALPAIRSYLKLYPSIPLSKLAKYCLLPEERVLEHLMALKLAGNQMVHDEGETPLDGSRKSVSDLHFYIEGSNVLVDEGKAPQWYGQYFLTHALKFQQAYDDLGELKNSGTRSK